MSLAKITLVTTSLDTANACADKYLNRVILQIGALNRAYSESIWSGSKPTIAEIKTAYRVGCEYLDFLSSLNVITTQDYQQLSDRLHDCRHAALNRKQRKAEHAAMLKKIANA